MGANVWKQIDDPSPLVPSEPVFFIDATSIVGKGIVFKMNPHKVDNTLQDIQRLRVVNPQLFREEYAANQQRLRAFLQRVEDVARMSFSDMELLADICLIILCYRRVVAGIPVPVITGADADRIVAAMSIESDPGLMGGHWCKSPFLRRLYLVRKRRVEKFPPGPRL